MTTDFNENSSGCEYQFSSTVYRTSGGTESRESESVKVDGVKEWEVEKILNKRKIRGVVKYLVHWKMFITESNI